MKKLILTSLVFYIGLTNPLLGQEQTLDSLDVFIKNQAEKFHIPGIAACVVRGDSIVWQYSYGYANIEDEKKMTTESILNIASISKTITATAIMQLWEKGLLKLDADVNDYIDFSVRNPNFPNIPITIKQLLTHTSSIADGSSIKIGYQCGDPKKELKDWLFNYFNSDGEYYNETDNFQNKKPASFREYSNIGFGLLGLIVEEISGVSFNEYVKAKIFEPLEMSNSGYFLNEIDLNKLVTPYLFLGPLQRNLNDSKEIKLPYFNPYCDYSFWNYPDGLVRTSVLDLAKFATAYMNGGVYNGKRILKNETIDLMMSPQLTEDINEDKDQGLCWFQSPSLYPTWYHGGSDPGVSTRMYINKEEKLAMIVFENVNVDNTFYIIKELYKRFK